jgi:hypothetical protein
MLDCGPIELEKRLSLEVITMTEEKLYDLELSEAERQKLIEIGKNLGYTESGVVARAIKEFLSRYE